jgi:transcriptional regulator with GAF, ATPase, and Fis domain
VKRSVARALHALGPLRARRLVTVNCSAVIATLFESELFGHVRGAFTGALDAKGWALRDGRRFGIPGFGFGFGGSTIA